MRLQAQPAYVGSAANGVDLKISSGAAGKVMVNDEDIMALIADQGSRTRALETLVAAQGSRITTLETASGEKLGFAPPSAPRIGYAARPRSPPAARLHLVLFGLDLRARHPV